MSKTNCVNCGAAKDTSEIRCPFCGTTYLDFTAIDFSKNDPVICAFVLPWSDRRTVMRMKAIPILDEICMTTPTIEVTSLGDSFRRYMDAPPDINVGISFKPLMQNDGTMFTLKEERGEDL